MTAKIVDVNTETESQTVPSQDIQEKENVLITLGQKRSVAIDLIRELRKTKKEVAISLEDPSQYSSYQSLRDQEKTLSKTIKDLDASIKSLEPTGPKQKTYNQVLSEIHGSIASNFMTVLKGFNVSAKPKHIINPLAVRSKGVSGDGDRQVIKNLYFMNHDSVDPQTVNLYEDIPEEAILFAEEAIGYTTVTLQFKDSDSNPHTIIGKTICSANDHYSGNFGLIMAFRDAFDQIEAREINTPIRNLSYLINDCQNMIGLSFMRDSR